jgi:hypothetical protein
LDARFADVIETRIEHEPSGAVLHLGPKQLHGERAVVGAAGALEVSSQSARCVVNLQVGTPIPDDSLHDPGNSKDYSPK